MSNTKKTDRPISYPYPQHQHFEPHFELEEGTSECGNRKDHGMHYVDHYARRTSYVCPGVRSDLYTRLSAFLADQDVIESRAKELSRAIIESGVLL